MPKYVVERDIPGVGGWSAEQMRTVTEKSRALLREMGPEIQWVTSYVTGDKLYCVRRPRSSSTASATWGRSPVPTASTR